MQLIKKTLTTRAKNLTDKILDDNLFLLSSSVSYYSALGLAPFLLIILGVASILGQNIQSQIIEQASRTFSPQVGEMIKLIFLNVNKGVSIGSISGIIGLVVLLSTASMVFLQFRYAFDVIYGYFNPHVKRSVWEIVFERLFAMFVIVGGAVLLIISFSVATIAEYLFGPGIDESFLTQIAIFLVNFVIYVTLFTGVHFFTPSKRPNFVEALKISTLSSIFFIIGNYLLAWYLKGVAANSVYGAAGTLLVFLVWSYYSSFTVFLSVEVFIYLRRIGRIRS